MFSDLTDEALLDLKRQVREYLISQNFGTTQAISVDGLNMSLNQQNAFRFLEELTKEEKRRKRGNNPFLAIDLR